MRGGTAGRLTGASPSGECGFHVCLRVRVQCTYAWLNMSIWIVHAPMRTFGDEGMKRAETARRDRERNERERERETDGWSDRDSLRERARIFIRTGRMKSGQERMDGIRRSETRRLSQAMTSKRQMRYPCARMHLCVCVCVYVCYIHVHIHMWMRMNTNMYTHMYSYI